MVSQRELDLIREIMNKPEVHEDQRRALERLLEEHAGLKKQLERALKGSKP